MSTRSLAKLNQKGIATTYRQLLTELQALPKNNDLTIKLCGRNKFWGVLLVDGKYVKVKDYDKKIPFIFGIDYETHDIPICVLAPSENYIAMKNFFIKIKNIGYKLRGIVCDDNEATKMDMREVFPDAFIQLCHTHFLENIRKLLGTRRDERYRPFVFELQQIIFNRTVTKKKKIKKALHELLIKYQNDEKAVSALLYINKNIDELTNHLKIGGCPKTNNLIESYNKQLNGRLKTIQGFQSSVTAERWLSAWILRRRLTVFTDCKKRFKKLNGKCSLEKTIRSDAELPDLF